MQRPVGTDGSDHVYREKVESEYGTLPLRRKWGGTCMHLLLLPMIFRSAWFIGTSLVAADLAPNLPAILIAAVFSCAYVSWLAAGTGTWKESLPMVQISNTCNLIWMSMMAFFVYKHHFSVDSSVTRISTALGWQEVSPGMMRVVEGVPDLACLLLGLFCVANIKP